MLYNVGLMVQCLWGLYSDSLKRQLGPFDVYAVSIKINAMCRPKATVRSCKY